MEKRKVIKIALIKTVGYRILVIAYEMTLAFILPYFGIETLSQFIVINNVIKFLGYFLYELVWLGYLRTRFNLIKKVLKI